MNKTRNVLLIMFYWSITSLVHFWPPQFLILATPMHNPLTKAASNFYTVACLTTLRPFPAIISAAHRKTR